MTKKVALCSTFSLLLPLDMRKTTLLIGFSLLFLALSMSCGRHGRGSVVINTDSIFYDLNKEKVAQRAKMTDKMFRNFAKSGMNGVALYAEQGIVVYEEAFGWRDLTKRQKDSLRIDDAFQLSSDSKMFTAMAVMLLQAEGKLDYDDDIRIYIPELPYEGVTVRHLLNHRSGLPRYDAMADKHWPDRKIPFSNEAMIKMLVEKHPDPYGTAGGDFFYNNINYALLASVVERASGQHFEDFMRERIFEPVGMDHSYIYSMRNENAVSMYMPVEAHGHEMYKSGPVKSQNDYLNGVMGDKIMFSTVGDLWKFNQALDAHLLLPDSLQNEAFRPGSPVWKNDENYGFGWRMNKNYPNVFFHYGWWKGYRSVIVRDVAHRRFLAVLNNTTWLIPPDAIWDFISDTTVMLPESEAWVRPMD